MVTQQLQHRWLNAKADIIEQTLQRHRVTSAVVGGIITTTHVKFHMKAQVGTKVSKVAKLAEEIALALDAREARISRSGSQITIQVPRAKPQPQPGEQAARLALRKDIDAPVWEIANAYNLTRNRVEQIRNGIKERKQDRSTQNDH